MKHQKMTSGSSKRSSHKGLRSSSLRPAHATASAQAVKHLMLGTTALAALLGHAYAQEQVVVVASAPSPIPSPISSPVATVVAPSNTLELASASTTPTATATANPEIKAVSTLSATSATLASIAKIWMSEDPSLLTPNLSIGSTARVALQDGQLAQAITFSVYTNYSAFIKKAQISVYAPKDLDRLQPIAVIPVEINGLTNQVSVKWDGAGLKSLALREGDVLQYQLRVYDAEQRWDETKVGSIAIVSSVERAQALDQLKQSTSLETQLRSQETGLSLEEFTLSQDTFGQSALTVQNIPLLGSKVRVRGQSVKEGYELSINGQVVPIDLQRRFVMEYLLPVGTHRFEVKAKIADKEIKDTLNTQVSGEYFHMVGLADLTYSKNSYSGSIDAVTPEDYARFNGQQTDGRLAFYLKGKIKGQYLLTAQADTQEKELKNIFKGFFKADKNDVLRRIDPDVYYPVYGDDSISTKDVDTSGRLYVRLDWDKSSAVWGNVATDLNGNSLAAYNRSLYGAKLAYRSLETNPLGESKSQVKAFAAEQQTAPGRTEFLGTGGSLYYLRHTDIVPGSQQVTLEMRDPYSSRVVQSFDLKAGRDYEIDAFQGRIILSRSLLQITKDNNTAIQDQPLGGLNNILVTRYEYYPQEFDSNNFSAGLQAKQWLGDKIAVGATYAKENRSGQDYELAGADLTYQAGQGTWIKAETAQSKSTQAPQFFSTDGGLKFAEISQVNSLLENKGSAHSLEARLNTQEMGLTTQPVKVAAWLRDRDPNFSSGHSTTSGRRQIDTGVEVLTQATPDVQILASARKVESRQELKAGNQSEVLDKVTAAAVWQASDSLTLTAELQKVQVRKISTGVNSTSTDKTITTGSDANSVSEAGLAGIKVAKRLNDKWEVYAAAQASFAQSNYDPNHSVTIGSKYAIDEASAVSLDYTEGDRGSAFTASAEYKRSADHSIYGSYTYSPTTTAIGSGLNDNLIASRTFNQSEGWTVGQRLQLAQRWKLNTETQSLEDSSSKGLVNSVGLEFAPKQNWAFGLSAQKGSLSNKTGNSTGIGGINEVNEQDRIDRQALSLSGSYTDEKTDWSSKLEQRQDTPSQLAQDKTKQWLSTNKASYKVSDDWKLLGKVNYSITNKISSVANSQVKEAKLIDSSIGFAYRPLVGKWNVLAKYGYFYDLAPTGQMSSNGSEFDQESQIASLEGTYQVSPRVELAGKVAKRQTAMRLERGTGQWFSNNATYAAAQVRVKLPSWVNQDNKEQDQAEKEQDVWTGWGLTAEYRMLKTEQDGVKKGALIGIDKDINANMRVGVGYNFTDFSADLTQLSYKTKGFYFNLVGRF